MANYYGQRDEKAQGFYGADAGGNDGWGASSDFSYPYVDPHQQPSQQFASFDYDTPQQQAPNFYTPTVGSSYGGASASPAPSYFVPQTAPMDNKVGDSGSGFDNFDDEPPLLEELGINPYHILEKTLSVLNPLRNTDAIVLQDTDIVGPVVFCVLFGVILLFSGKIHFGYIYGIGVMGCIAMYFLLNMMSVAGVSLGVTVSVLGYCLLPMVGLAGINLILSLQGAVGTLFTALAVLWCSLSASKLFVTALGLQKQQPLVAYPCALLYGVFALLAVF